MQGMKPADEIVGAMSIGELRQEWRAQEDGLIAAEQDLEDIALALWPDGDGERPVRIAGDITAAEIVSGVRSLHEYCARLLEENEKLRGSREVQHA